MPSLSFAHAKTVLVPLPLDRVYSSGIGRAGSHSGAIGLGCDGVSFIIHPAIVSLSVPSKVNDITWIFVGEVLVSVKYDNVGSY